MEGKGLLRSSSLKDGGAGSSLRGDVTVYALHVPMLRGMHSVCSAGAHARKDGGTARGMHSVCSACAVLCLRGEVAGCMDAAPPLRMEVTVYACIHRPKVTALHALHVPVQVTACALHVLSL
jgi:hypothetical protein